MRRGRRAAALDRRAGGDERPRLGALHREGEVEQEGVVPEAFGLIEKGVVDEEQFRDFTFTHAAEMFLRTNPRFFEGTSVESSAAALVEERATPRTP